MDASDFRKVNMVLPLCRRFGLVLIRLKDGDTMPFSYFYKNFMDKTI